MGGLRGRTAATIAYCRLSGCAEGRHHRGGPLPLTAGRSMQVAAHASMQLLPEFSVSGLMANKTLFLRREGPYDGIMKRFVLAGAAVSPARGITPRQWHAPRVRSPMSQVPQLPDPGSRAPRPSDPSRWIDLIAFLGVLALGGILMTVVPATAVSVATICVALGGLYRLWKLSQPASGGGRSRELPEQPEELSERRNVPPR
jgi:hypothetical protein